MPEQNSNTCHLVLLETSGNQAYIFGTNRLRDIIGASELVHRAGTRYVAEALEEVTQIALDSDDLGTALRRQAKIEDGAAAEVLVATSGKALLLFRCACTAKKFITAWSKRIVREAPGLDAFGVIAPQKVDLSKPFGDEESIARAIYEAHRAYEAYRNRRPSPEARFQRLPFVEACRESRLPANTLTHKTRSAQSETQPASLSRAAKIDARYSTAIQKRWTKLYDGLKKWFDNPEEMEKSFGNLAWFGVVHADGNGLGQLFLAFGDYVEIPSGQSPGRAYINAYREFSLQIDDLGQQAFRKAAGIVKESKGVKVPLVPIVVGGDDLTVLLDGQQAIDFAQSYIEAFCGLTETAGDTMAKVLVKAKGSLGAKRLGACAGISITKPHFPFSVSYALAGDLTASAKEAKRKLSPAAAALDFHILYDSTAGSLDLIRRQYDNNGLRLTSKPYVLSARGKEGDPWYRHHAHRRLKGALDALRRKNNNGRLQLSSTQAHAVRERLFLEDKSTQETFWKRTLKNANLTGEWRITSSNGDAETLFEGDDLPSTVFLDALEAREFITEEQADKANQHTGEAAHAIQ